MSELPKKDTSSEKLRHSKTTEVRQGDDKKKSESINHEFNFAQEETDVERLTRSTKKAEDAPSFSRPSALFLFCFVSF